MSRNSRSRRLPESHRDFIKQFTESPFQDVPKLCASGLENKDVMFTHFQRPELIHWTPVIEHIYKYYEDICEKAETVCTVIIPNDSSIPDLTVVMCFHHEILALLRKNGNVVPAMPPKAYAVLNCSDPEVVFNFLSIVMKSTTIAQRRTSTVEAPVTFNSLAQSWSPLTSSEDEDDAVTSLTLKGLLESSTSLWGPTSTCSIPVPSTTAIIFPEIDAQPDTLPYARFQKQMEIVLKLHPELSTTEAHALWVKFRMVGTSDPMKKGTWLGIALLSSAFLIQQTDMEVTRPFWTTFRSFYADVPNVLAETADRRVELQKVQYGALWLTFSCHSSVCDGNGSQIPPSLLFSHLGTSKGQFFTMAKHVMKAAQNPLDSWMLLTLDLLFKFPTYLLNRRAAAALNGTSTLLLQSAELYVELVSTLSSWSLSNNLITIRILRTIGSLCGDETARGFLIDHGVLNALANMYETMFNAIDVKDISQKIAQGCGDRRAASALQGPAAVAFLKDSRAITNSLLSPLVAAKLESTLSTMITVWRAAPHTLRPRELIEKKGFLECLLNVYRNVYVFDPYIVSHASNIITTMLNDDPQIFSALLQDGTVQAILSCFQQPITDVRSLQAAPPMLFALSLNTEGRTMIVDMKVLSNVIRCLLSSLMTTSSEVTVDISSSFGKDIAELTKHYNQLQSEVISAVTDVLSLVQEQVKKPGSSKPFMPTLECIASFLTTTFRDNYEESARMAVGTKIVEVVQTIATKSEPEVIKFHPGITDALSILRTEGVWTLYLNILTEHAIAAEKQENLAQEIDVLNTLIQIIFPSFGSGTVTGLVANVWGDKAKALAGSLLKLYVHLLKTDNKKEANRQFLQSVEHVFSGLFKICNMQLRVEERQSGKNIQEIIQESMSAVIREINGLDFSLFVEDWSVVCSMLRLISSVTVVRSPPERGVLMTPSPALLEGLITLSETFTTIAPKMTTETKAGFDETITLVLSIIKNVANLGCMDEEVTVPSQKKKQCMEAAIACSKKLITIPPTVYSDTALFRLLEMLGQSLVKEEKRNFRGTERSVLGAFVPDPAAVRQLEEMGYVATVAENALRELRNNNVVQAAELLTLQSNGPSGLSRVLAQDVVNYVVEVLKTHEGFEFACADVLISCSSCKRNSHPHARGPISTDSWIAKGDVLKALVPHLNDKTEFQVLHRFASTMIAFCSNVSSVSRESMVTSTPLVEMITATLSALPIERSDAIIALISLILALTQPASTSSQQDGLTRRAGVCRQFVLGLCKATNCPLSHDTMEANNERVLLKEAKLIAEAIVSILPSTNASTTTTTDGAAATLTKSRKTWEDILLEPSFLPVPLPSGVHAQLSSVVIRYVQAAASGAVVVSPRNFERLLQLAHRLVQEDYNCATMFVESNFFSCMLQVKVPVTEPPTAPITSICSFFFGIIKCIAEEPMYIQHYLENAMQKLLVKANPEGVSMASFLSELETQRRRHAAYFMKAVQARCILTRNRDVVNVQAINLDAPLHVLKPTKFLDIILQALMSAALDESRSQTSLLSLSDVFTNIIGLCIYPQATLLVKCNKTAPVPTSSFLHSVVQRYVASTIPERSLPPQTRVAYSRQATGLLAALFSKYPDRCITEIVAGIQESLGLSNYLAIIDLCDCIHTLHQRTVKSGDRAPALEAQLASISLRGILGKVLQEIPYSSQHITPVLVKVLKALEINLQKPHDGITTTETSEARPSHANELEISEAHESDPHEEDEEDEEEEGEEEEDEEEAEEEEDEEGEDDAEEEDDDDGEDEEYHADNMFLDTEGLEILGASPMNGSELFRTPQENIFNAMGGSPLTDAMMIGGFDPEQLHHRILQRSYQPPQPHTPVTVQPNTTLMTVDQLNQIHVNVNAPPSYQATSLRNSSASRGPIRPLPFEINSDDPHAFMEMQFMMRHMERERTRLGNVPRVVYSNDTLTNALFQYVMDVCPANARTSGPQADNTTTTTSPPHVFRAPTSWSDDVPSPLQQPSSTTAGTSLAASLRQALLAPASPPAPPQIVPPPTQNSSSNALEEQLLALLRGNAPLPPPPPTLPTTPPALPTESLVAEPTLTPPLVPSATTDGPSTTDAATAMAALFTAAPAVPTSPPLSPPPPPPPPVTVEPATTEGDVVAPPVVAPPSTVVPSTSESRAPAWENSVDPTCLGELPSDIRLEILRANYDVIVVPGPQRGVTLHDGTIVQTCLEEGFMTLVPPEVQHELLALEVSMNTERQQRRAAAPPPPTTSAPQQQTDVDTATLLATLPPEIRQEILREMPDEEIARLPAELAAEARNLRERHHRHLTASQMVLEDRLRGGRSMAVPALPSRAMYVQSTSPQSTSSPMVANTPEPTRSSIKVYTPMVNREFLVTTLRVIFAPQFKTGLEQVLTKVLNYASRCTASAEILLEFVYAIIRTTSPQTQTEASLAIVREISPSVGLYRISKSGVVPQVVLARALDILAALLNEGEVTKVALGPHVNLNLLRFAQGMMQTPQTTSWELLEALINTTAAAIPSALLRAVLSTEGNFPHHAHPLKWFGQPNGSRCTSCMVPTLNAFRCAECRIGVCATCFYLAETEKAKEVSATVDAELRSLDIFRNCVRCLDHPEATTNAMQKVRNVLAEAAKTYDLTSIFEEMRGGLAKLIGSISEALRMRHSENLRSQTKKLIFVYDFLQERGFTVPTPQLNTLWVDTMAFLSQINAQLEKKEITPTDIPDITLPLIEVFLTHHTVTATSSSNSAGSTGNSPRLSENASPTSWGPVPQKSQISEEADAEAQKSLARGGKPTRTGDYDIPVPRRGYEDTLSQFVENTKSLLIQLVRQDTDIFQRPGPLRCVLRYSQCVEFETKKKWFRDALKKIIPANGSSEDDIRGHLSIKVQRNRVFEDTFSHTRHRLPRELLYPRVSFKGEEGVDAGGLLREWFTCLGREMLNADYALFVKTSELYTYQPNPHSAINSEHLAYFRMCGRIVGLSILHDFPVDVHYTRSIYKHLLGLEPTYRDLEALDPLMYKNLVVWTLENDVTPMQYTFEIDVDRFGAKEQVEVIPDGKNILVTNENKHDFVARVASYKMSTMIADQIRSFLHGFYEIIPKQLLSIFNESELEILISGMPDFDVDDLRAHTQYQHCSATTPQVQWLWQILHSMTVEQRTAFWQFISGSCKVPAGGFKYLEGQNGRLQFTVQLVKGSKKLPVAHTCFYILELPEYENYEEMKDKLTKAVLMGADHFGTI